MHAIENRLVTKNRDLKYYYYLLFTHKSTKSTFIKKTNGDILFYFYFSNRSRFWEAYGVILDLYLYIIDLLSIFSAHFASPLLPFFM